VTRRGGYDEVGRAARAVHDSAESLGARIPGSAFVTTVFGDVRQLEYELEGAPEGALDDLDRNLLGAAADALEDLARALRSVPLLPGESDVTLDQEQALMEVPRRCLRSVYRLTNPGLPDA
jgi:hypothetical protein